MSTRSRNRSNPQAVRPLVGRLHELATTRPVTTPANAKGWWRQPGPAASTMMPSKRAVVFGSLGRGKSAVRAPSSSLGRDGSKTGLMRWPYLDALRFSGRPVVVFDEAGSVELVDLSSVTETPINPLTFGTPTSGSSADPARAW